MRLEWLERGNLFVVPLDDKRHWYRYHQLFADVLYAHLMAEQPAQVATLHRRASEWYERNHSPAEAIRHALAAEDFERAAGLIELAWPAMDGSFQTATWLRWVKAIPEELVRVRPVLSVDYAWAFLNGGELEAAEARLYDAEQWLDTSEEIGERAEAPLDANTQPSKRIVVDEAQFRTLPASIATARTFLAQARGSARLYHVWSTALDLLPETDHLPRGITAALLGLAYWTNGDLDAAHRTLADGMASMRIAGNLLFALRGTYSLADIRLAQGRLRDAISIYEQALQLATQQGELVLATLNCHHACALHPRPDDDGQPER